MKYFDALYTVYQPSRPDEVWYHVVTVRASSLERAVPRARLLKSFHFPYMGEERFTANFIGVDQAGSYDQFIGKYQGQFIDEAFGRF